MLLIRTCCFMQIYLTSWRKNWEKVKTKFCINTWFSNLGMSGIPLESLHNLLTHLPAYLFSIQLNEAQNSILFCLHEQNMSTQTVMIKPCWHVQMQPLDVTFLGRISLSSSHCSRCNIWMKVSPGGSSSVFFACAWCWYWSPAEGREGFKWNTKIEISRTGLHSIILLTFFHPN